MPTQNSDLKFRLLGEDVSAGRTFSKVGEQAKAAHGAVSELGQTLNSTGAFAPLMQGLDAISAGFQHIQDNGKRASVVMQGVGIGVAAAGAALLGLGAAAQQAHAGLAQAIQDAGGTYSEFSKSIEDTVAKAGELGHSASDTENALARLTTATQDPQKALGLMGLTANIAAARNMNLTDSAQLLTTALAGNTRVFRQFGINVGTGKLSADQLNQALNELNQRLSGRAQAQADTFSGRIKAMAVEFENAGEQLTKFAPLLLTVGSAMTIVSSTWDVLAKKKERDIALNAEVAASTRPAAVGEASIPAAGLAGGAGLTAAESAGTAGLFTRLGGAGTLLRAGGLAIGGTVIGQVAGAGVGGKAGGAVSGLATGAGIGAGIGMLGGPLDFLSVPVGAGIGALAGGALGFFGHHSPKPKFEEMQKQIAEQQAVDTSTRDSWMFDQFDPMGNPKAQKIAAATDALTKAKVRLGRAQEDLNKAESKGTDPTRLAAAEAHLTAAQANLQKAQYVGGTARIASAQASVDQAQARLKALHAHPDVTAAQRHVTDAHHAVTAAHHALSTAQHAGEISARGFLRGLTGQATEKTTAAHDVATLVDRFHISGPILAQIEKQGDVAVHSIATSMTAGLAKRFNQQGAALEDAAKAWQAATGRAFGTSAEALGANLAAAATKSFNAKMKTVGFADQAPSTNPFTPTVGSTAQQHPGGVALPPLAGTRHYTGPIGGVQIHTVNVTAQNPQQLASALADQARHRALGGQTGLARP